MVVLYDISNVNKINNEIRGMILYYLRGTVVFVKPDKTSGDGGLIDLFV